MASDRSSSQERTSSSQESNDVLDVEDTLAEIMDLDGAVGAAIVDYENGMTFGTVGGRNLDMELAGAGTSEVVRSERNLIHDLRLNERIEDILISLKGQYHLVQMCQHHENVFIYLVINRDQGNLGLARRSINKVDEQLELS